jgi:hypothetical protein
MMIWKDQAVIQFQELSRDSYGGPAENHKESKRKGPATGMIYEPRFSQIRSRNAIHYTETLVLSQFNPGTFFKTKPSTEKIYCLVSIIQCVLGAFLGDKAAGA